jgi:Arc/MetJ-type ribon-helix-helix transcriptional regulator
MGMGMATKKVTITLENAQLEAVQKLVESGGSRSVSAFVQHAVRTALNDVAGWGALLGQALETTGGPLTKRERDWADGILKASWGAKRRRRAA